MPRYFPNRNKELVNKARQVNISRLDKLLVSLMQEMKLASHPLFPKVQFEAILSKYLQVFSH
jgi:DNA polymerase-3 subunit delta'